MNRLKEIREQRGLKMAGMARLIGIPYTTYRGYELEERGLTSETILMLTQKLDVTADYLLGKTDDPKGYGAEFVWESVDDEVLRKTTEGLKYDHIGVDLLQKYHNLTFEGQMKVDAYINDLIASGLYTRSSDSKVG